MSIEKTQLKDLGNYIKAALSKQRGLRIGEATVISYNVHGNSADNPSQINVLTDLDAGETYLKLTKPQTIIHVDVFHEPAAINPHLVAKRISDSISLYLKAMRTEHPELDEQSAFRTYHTLCRKIFVKTALGFGDIDYLLQHVAQTNLHNSRQVRGNVHILLDIPFALIDIILDLVLATEQAITAQGYELRKVERILHCDSSDIRHNRESSFVNLPLPMQVKNNLKAHEHNNNIMFLATAVGGIENALKLLEGLTPPRNMIPSMFSKQFNDLPQILEQLQEKGIVTKDKVMPSLTEHGAAVKAYLKSNQNELEAQLRKAIRKVPLKSNHHHTSFNSDLKSKKMHLTDRRKVVKLDAVGNLSDIALPETVVSAVTREFMQDSPKFRLTKEDIHLYGKKSHAPIDTCLAIDCSGSMVGDKIRAVLHLAEHLLLSTKEKVGLVSFQERTARVVTPFTKNYNRLKAGLNSIAPEGFTPLATGVVESLNFIRISKARNPLLVIITDGLPNFPLWTSDAQADALKAADRIAEAKVRLVVIGILPNPEFLEEFCKRAKGNLYVVDDLDKEDLVNIVRTEWHKYKTM